MRNVYTLSNYYQFLGQPQQISWIPFFLGSFNYLTLFVGDQEVASSGSLFFTEQKEKGLSVSQAGFSIHVAL